MNKLPRILWSVSSQATKTAFICSRSIYINAAFHHEIFSASKYSVPRRICNSDLYNKQTVRSYAKSKDKGKDRGNKPNPGKVQISGSQIASVLDYEKLKSQLAAAIEHLKEDFAKNLSLRSTTGTIETMKIPFDGKDYELQELAQIIRKNPKTIILNMSAFPTAIPDVLKTIQGSGLNLNPQQDGTTIFIPVPKVTKEHREHLAKNAKVLYTKHKDNIKQINVNYTKQLKGKTGVSADLIQSVQTQLNALTDLCHTEAKTLFNNKHLELIGGKD